MKRMLLIFAFSVVIALGILFGRIVRDYLINLIYGVTTGRLEA